MEGLDFSALSDDQVLGLMRATLREITSRSSSLGAAAHQAMLDEAERARIARDAGEREAAKLRAEERARVAAEAAAQVRARHAETERHVSQARATEAADKAREDATRAQNASKSLLRKAAALVGRKPQDISVLLVATAYGRRVLINVGFDVYDRDHLSDWRVSDGKIVTTKTLIRQKPDLAALSAEIAARHPTRDLYLLGNSYDWTGEPE